ncbi:uncharacterized protein [Malus domestica]|uniref:uncharacterized protein n=1 Tax=Malus domestica TaxID=3750 RepID=UPI0010AA5EF1|nr:uncharacterized protein LOC114819753 [Malus domestica]
MDGSNLSLIPDDRCKSAKSEKKRKKEYIKTFDFHSCLSQMALKNMASSSKKDFAWQWTKDLDPVTMHFYCVFCNHKCTGSISIFKHHLGGVSSGGMISCKKVLPNVKEECFANVMGTKEKRKASHELCHGGGEESESVDMGTTRTPYVSSRSGSVSTTHSQEISSFLPTRSRGPLDKYVTSEAHQTTLNTPFKKEERRQASRALARWFQIIVIPFNAANNEYYVHAMKLVSNFGPDFDAPTSHEYRTWMLKEKVEDVQSMMKEHQKASSIKNEDLLYDYLDDVIQQIGKENVVQVISDNASNYKNVGAKLMERKENVWWTACTAHCIDLMLEDISKIPWFDDTLKHAAWWERFGHKTPELMKFAIRIHTKRRNRLEHKRLNALAYVKYNLALQQRSKKMREKYDPIVVEEIASYDEWITEIEDLVLPEDLTWLEDELLYNVEVVRNVPPPVYESGSYIQEPRVFSSSSSS